MSGSLPVNGGRRSSVQPSPSHSAAVGSTGGNSDQSTTATGNQQTNTGRSFCLFDCLFVSGLDIKASLIDGLTWS